MEKDMSMLTELERLTLEQQILYDLVTIACNSDNMHVDEHELDYLHAECDRLGLHYMVQDINDKKNEIQLNLFK